MSVIDTTIKTYILDKLMFSRVNPMFTAIWRPELARDFERNSRNWLDQMATLDNRAQ
jgi:hypothetical protein